MLANGGDVGQGDGNRELVPPLVLGHEAGAPVGHLEQVAHAAVGKRLPLGDVVGAQARGQQVFDREAQEGVGALAGTDTGALVPYVKIPFLIFFSVCAGYTMRRATYVERADAGSEVLNGLPAWSAVMVLASPLIWEHHLVFLAIPFLAVAKKMRMPAEWVAYSLVYLLTFLLPTFDFYPWSFGRLFSAVVLMVLMVRSCRTADAEWVARAGQRFDAFFGCEKKGA